MDPEEQQRRPYLDPKPGENLPEKTVSAKAMTRLQHSADAIAATKRAIEFQGNQIPALRATNLNSQYRLLVMRDAFAQPCWEYTPEAEALAAKHKEADVAAKADLAHGGNCGEHAWLAFHYLREKASGEPINRCAKRGLDHAFVIVGDTKNDKDADLAVSDPWPNNPTACLWEDHFAHCSREEIQTSATMTADGNSYKAAIAAGLKLTAFGKKMAETKESDEKTREEIRDAKANHYWNHDDAASEKFEYKTDPAQQPARAGAQPEVR